MPLIKSANVPSSIAPFSMTNIETQARSLLGRAQRKADELLAAAQAEAESMKKAAYAQGLADGRREGTAQGVAEGKKAAHAQALTEHREKFTSAAAAMNKAAEQFNNQRGELEAGGLRSVIELAAAIARRVTKRQAMLDPQVLIENLKGAMQRVTHAADVRIALRPADMATIKNELPALKMAWPQLSHVELVEDATLTAGGCRLFTASGAVDGDLDGQLDRVIEQLLPQTEKNSE
jgi:flagellar assembly protein FliH